MAADGARRVVAVPWAERLGAALAAPSPDDLVARLDPLGLGAALGRAAMATVTDPAAPRALAAAAQAGAHALGEATDPGGSWFALCRAQHAALAAALGELVERAELDTGTRVKVRFALDQLLAAADPVDLGLVARRAVRTGGRSLLRGGRNLVRDVVGNRGLPRQVPAGRLRVGRDLAVTEGAVVYRNRLIELIQYAPRTEAVHQVPVLFSPPWINKYYVLDLAPGRSLAQWAVEHGHTCFMISYRNPDGRFRDVGLADYLRDGPLRALRVIGEITGSPDAHLVALCLGGTLAAATAAWLAAAGQPGVRSLTLLNTLLDFSEPGPLGMFADPEVIDNLDRLTRGPGYLPAPWLKAAFDLLRPGDLIWRYARAGWLLGEDPPAFDLLAWNADATRLPRRMQLEYLRWCYRDNLLARGRLELAGRRLAPGGVRADSYVVAAETDHITPWRSVYAGARLLGGSARFVLTSSGHLAGVVNPPGPRSKARHWRDDRAELPADPATWRAAAGERPGSWWPDWTAWLAARSGPLRPPPPLGGPGYPPVGPAPGRYVHD